MAENKNFKKESTPAKNKMSQKEYVKYCVKAKRTREYEDVKAQVFEGAYIVLKDRNLENLDQQYMQSVPEKYFHICHGTVAVCDKTSKETVLVARCLSFDKMTTEEYEEYEKITTTLISMAKGASVVTTNSAKRTGRMYAIGWRGGSHKDFTLGWYVPQRQIQEDASKLENWKHEQELLPEISTIFGKKFCNLAPTLFQKTKMEMMETQVPSLTTTEFDILHRDSAAFCSNLTYTIQDFSNCFHTDRDSNSYSFGIWAPAYSQTGKLAGRENGFDSTGGHFLLGPYKVCVDFNAYNGIVEIIWRGKRDFHSTIPCKTSSEFTRIGTSIQISHTLVQRVKKLHEMYAKGDDINKKVRGVTKIIESKLKKLK